MAPQSRYRGLSLTAIFFLFLSLFNIATAAPLLEDHVGGTKVVRAPQAKVTTITETMYINYLNKYFKDNNKYVFYSGEAVTQVKNFLTAQANKGVTYYSYNELFNVPANEINAPEDQQKHPWWKEFKPAANYEDDAEASSIAMAKIASGDVLVFGAMEYKTKGQASFYTQQEAPILLGSLSNHKIHSLNHMVKGATEPSQVIAKEDAHGNMNYQPGHKAGETNASTQCSSSTSRDLLANKPKVCDQPTINRKCGNEC